MTILKIIGCVFIFSSCSLVGFYLSNELTLRLKQLQELKRILLLLQGDIRYASTPLPEAVDRLTFRCDGVFTSFFQELSDKLSEYQGETFSKVWEAALEHHLKKTSLNNKDLAQMKALGDIIGYLDKEMQMNTFDLFLSQMEHEIQELLQSMTQKKRVYSSLGVLGGAFLTIILL